MARKPNLLFVFTDEQRFDTMRCYGNDFVQTPNLNRLADESFVFDNAYVTQPVCTPSRSTILTGQWPHTNGCTGNNIPLRPETRCLSEMLEDDYLCGYYGKWHLGDEVIPQHGFEGWLGVEDMYRRYYSRPEYRERLSDYHHFLLSKCLQPDRESWGAKVFGRQFAAKQPPELTKAMFTAERTAEFLHQNKGRPFALYVNFLEPHMPFTGPYDEMYDPHAVPVGPTFLQPPPENASLLHQRMSEHYMADQRAYGVGFGNDYGMRRVRAQYLGLVTLVDQAVGRILSALEESGQADNTIVVFTSDHGDMMGDHGMVAKSVMYEQALKVPCLLRVPALGRRGRRVPGRFSQLDFVPTLLELMGQEIPADCQGVSRAGVLRGQETLAANDVFVEWESLEARQPLFERATPEQIEILSSPWRTIVSHDNWKLALSQKDQSELYDLNSDPHEQTNLFVEPAHKGRIRDLAARIQAWQQASGDTCSLPGI